MHRHKALDLAASRGSKPCIQRAYVCGKRGLCTFIKRPMYMEKEAHVHGKRGLCMWKKRPMYMGKKAHVHGKRILSQILPRVHVLSLLNTLCTKGGGGWTWLVMLCILIYSMRNIGISNTQYTHL